MQFCANVLGEFGAAQNSPAGLGDINGAKTVIQNAIHGCLNPLRFDFQAERFAQQQNRRKDRAERAGYIFARERWRRAVNRFVQCGLSVAPAAERRNQSDRAGERRRFVAENIAKQITREDHVELRGAQQQLHRGIINVEMLERNLGILPSDARHGLPPQR